MPIGFHDIEVPAGAERDGRTQSQVDLVVDDVEQAGPSIELRVFLDNPDAGPATGLDANAGYAGSIHVYGYGAAASGTANAGRPPELPMSRRLTLAPDTLGRRGKKIHVTLVPVYPNTSTEVPYVGKPRVHLERRAAASTNGQTQGRGG
jgi:hypothetical protein